MNGRNCWKCGKPITDNCPDDGQEYTTHPPKFAHRRCPVMDEAKRKELRELCERVRAAYPATGGLPGVHELATAVPELLDDLNASEKQNRTMTDNLIQVIAPVCPDHEHIFKRISFPDFIENYKPRCAECSRLELATLQSENAALRERLERVEAAASIVIEGGECRSGASHSSRFVAVPIGEAVDALRAALEQEPK